MGTRLRKVVGVAEKAVDDRGRAVPGVDFKQSVEGVGTPGYPPIGLKLRLQAGLRAQTSSVSIINVAVSIGAVVIILGGSMTIHLLIPPLRGWNLPIFIVALAVFGAVRFQLSVRTAAPQIAATLVADGLCGGCGYRLIALEVAESDGCIMCPECGAAWKACRITRPCWSEPPMADPYAKRNGKKWLTSPPWVASMGQDDRGRMTPVVNGAGKVLLDGRTQELGRETLRAVRRSLRPVGRTMRIVVTGTFGLLVLVAFATGLTIALRGDWEVLWISLLPTGILLAVATSMWFHGPFGSPAKVRAAVLALARCPTCLEPLRVNAADPDGCTPCLLCGSAWKLPSREPG